VRAAKDGSRLSGNFSVVQATRAPQTRLRAQINLAADFKVKLASPFNGPRAQKSGVHCWNGGV
jgi:hypothetical protein